MKQDDIVAWKEKRLVFNSTPLKEVVQKIKDHYNVTIQLGDDSIGEKTVSGWMPNDNLEVLLQSLEATQDFKILRNKEGITITSP